MLSRARFAAESAPFDLARDRLDVTSRWASVRDFDDFDDFSMQGIGPQDSELA
jgi:hypothetical protein